ncbi:MAG: hypothetical protein ABJC26_05110 [Gemmatimonadaceae bacterium]
MVTIQIADDMLVLDVQGLDKLWSLRSTLRIPLAHVTSVEAAAGAKQGWFDGLRLGGTFIPGLLRAGTFYQNEGLVFWDVHNRENAIRIGLDDEHYKGLIVEVENPAAAVETIKNAIGGR